jgi:hypothetical protein
MIHAKGKGMMQTYWCDPKTETAISSEPSTDVFEVASRHGTSEIQDTDMANQNVAAKSEDDENPQAEDKSKLHEYFI